MHNTFIFTGRPGAGKGTQAKILAEKLEARFISAGASLRAFAEGDSLPARKVKEDIDSGLLVPYGIMVYIFYSIFLSLKEGEPVVLDGFARRPIEAEMMTGALTWGDRPFTVINLTIPDEVVQQRIDARKGLEQRGDEESVQNRLKEYEDHTAKAIQYFCENTTVIDIDGTQSIEAIAEEIWNKIQ
jgi:adenylate kinase